MKLFPYILFEKKYIYLYFSTGNGQHCVNCIGTLSLLVTSNSFFLSLPLRTIRTRPPCIPPGSLNRVPALAGGKGGNVTSAGWQVTLCDPKWHVSSRDSGVATWRTAIHLLLTLLYGRGSTSQHAWFEVGGDSRRPELSFVSPAGGSRRTDGRRRLEVQGRRVARRRRRKSIRAVLDLNKTRRPRTRPPPPAVPRRPRRVEATLVALAGHLPPPPLRQEGLCPNSTRRARPDCRRPGLRQVRGLRPVRSVFV